MSENGGRVWVYGVVPVDAQLKQLEGRDDLPEVWLVESGDLAAIVGDAPEDDPKATRNQALSHAHVLEAAVRDAPVVPMRFGLMSPSDEDVTSEILDQRHDQLAQLLDRLEGSVQMSLKVYYLEEPLLREILEEEPEAAELRNAVHEQPEEVTRDERVRLGELVGTAIEQRRERDSADILDQLGEIVEGAGSEPPEKELMVLNAPLLVARDRLEDFEATVEEVAEQGADRMHFKLLGPMPPYHFIDAEEPAAA
jgi:Gas vesicle synthesis protein GvpL/GvpF